MAPDRAPAPRFSLLCFGFVVCGFVTVLPGPLLPVMAAKWGLRDVQSGGFFAAEFAASTVGAIFSPHRLRRNLPTGYALMSAGVFLLMVASESVQAMLGHALALTAFSLIGLGIGLSVTATNLYVGSAAQETHRGDRARGLSVVNLWWGIGAVACPWLIAATEGGGWLRAFLVLVALGAAFMFFGLSPQLRVTETPSSIPARTSLAQDAGLLAFFAVFLFLYVGAENTISGWITTYAHRFSGLSLENASLLVSLFWIALLTGRALGAAALRRLPERAVLLPSLVLALAAIAVLLEPHSTRVVLVAVALAGAGFGPVFPLGVARLLARVGDHRNTGWVFAMCASGGAVLPWLAGLVSTHTGSLRLGFAVAVAAVAAILVLALLEMAILRRLSPLREPATRQT
ncbi:MAG TPA: MFS transporter [Acidobacteriaceae bacterium]|jgi:fucose permease|nr:MFS transporter [Acidobacteriaceae bacterium]